jgi:hypothetical protein
MATEKQIAANKRNAARSTGPRTSEGKARSRMNALRHGLSYLGTCIDDDTDTADTWEMISAGLQKLRLKRTEMLATIDDLIAAGNDSDAIDRGIKRIASLSRYEGRMYAARRRRG